MQRWFVWDAAAQCPTALSGYAQFDHGSNQRITVLMRGPDATLFSSYESAAAAIERTLKYAQQELLDLWPRREHLRIMCVEL